MVNILLEATDTYIVIQTPELTPANLSHSDYQTEGSEGYPFVAIIEDKRRRTMPVHRLVCEAFHGLRPFGRAVVRHLDGSRNNNMPYNLSWGSQSQNEADKRRHGRVSEGEGHGQAKLSKEGVRIIRASIPFGLWNTADAAKVFGVHPSTIRRIATGKRDWKCAK